MPSRALSRQFVARDISLKPRRLFQWAVFTLTVQYTVLLLFLFGVFSSTVYIYTDHMFGGDYPPFTSRNHEITDPALDRLRNALLISDAGLVVILPLLSYWLARRALLPVQKSYEEQQRFVDDASHELRTPLSVIQGELELAVAKQRTATEYKEAITISLDEIQSLNELVSGLLLIARGSQNNLRESFVPVELGDIVKSSVHAYAQIYEEKALKFKVNAIECSVLGSPELLKRCVANLLDNACKFSEPKSPVTVTLSMVGASAKLTIRDTGIGLSTQEMTKAFERFWRADEARSVRGHGLGLALVKQIVNLHLGKVELVSRERKGITVTVLLPVA